jgi:PTS system mannose-specific IIC component
MISQPIVAAPLTGWLLGDAATGLIIGAVLELIWVLDLPIGTFVPADSTVAAVSATSIAALGSGGTVAPLDLIGFSILLTTATAQVTMAADGIIRKRNAYLAEWAGEGRTADLEKRLVLAQLAGLSVFFLKSFVLYLVIVPAGLTLVLAFNILPDKTHAAMALFVKLLPLLGAALVIGKLSIRTLDRFVLAGFVTALVSALIFRSHPGVAVLLAAIAAWLGVTYRERRSA